MKQQGGIEMQNNRLTLENHWVPIENFQVSFGIKKNKPGSYTKRTQFPLNLVWAGTVHKFQGLSLISGVIRFDLERQKSFNQGLMYVALSRITNFESMYLIGSLVAIRLNLSAKNEYVRLRGLPELVLTNVSLLLTLLTARSLKKHVINILVDTVLLQNDVLALTEIQLQLEENVLSIMTQMSCHFSCQFNLNENKYRSIAVYSTHNVSVIDHQRYDCISVVTLIKPQFTQTLVTIAVIYRSTSSFMSVFLDRIARVLYQK